MNYLTKLYDCFCTPTEQNEEAEKIRRQLGETLDKERRKLLLAYGDALYAYCEENSYRSFVDGFRLAAGIAAELRLDQIEELDTEE